MLCGGRGCGNRPYGGKEGVKRDGVGGERKGRGGEVSTFQGLVRVMDSIERLDGGPIPCKGRRKKISSGVFSVLMKMGIYQTSRKMVSRLTVVSVSSRMVADAMGATKSSGWRTLIVRASQSWATLRTGKAPGGLTGAVWDW